MAPAGGTMYLSGMGAVSSNPWTDSTTRVVPGPCGRVRCEPGWRLDARWWRALSDFDLWLVWAGRGRMRLEDREVDLHAGVCLWMRPGRRYEAQQDPADRLGVTWLHFDAHRHGRRVAEAALPPEVLAWDDLAFADATARRVVDLSRRAPPGPATATLLLRGLLADYAAAAERAAGGGADAAAGVSPAIRRKIDGLRTRIREEPGAAWSVGSMAAEAGYGGDHFRVLFRAATGLSPRRFVTVERIQRARHLLRETGMNVGEVAAALGYADPFHFSRQFKAETGRSPSDFRRGGGVPDPPRTAG